MRNQRAYARAFFLTAVTTLSLVIAGSASAVSITLNVDAVFTSGFAPAPAVITPGSITGLLPGDIIQLSIDIANPDNDLINELIATMTFDPSILEFNAQFSSFKSTILEVPAGGGPTFPPAQALGTLGFPAIKLSSAPANDQIHALLFGSVAGSNGAGPEIGAATLFLTAIAPGASDVTLGFFFSDDFARVNGVQYIGAAAAAIVDINNPTIALQIIPEPGTALLMGLGLAGLATAGRRR